MGTEGNHEEFHTGDPVFWPGFEISAHRIEIISLAAYSICLVAGGHRICEYHMKIKLFYGNSVRYFASGKKKSKK